MLGANEGIAKGNQAYLRILRQYLALVKANKGVSGGKR